MPTSSQAMILRNIESTLLVPIGSYKTGHSSVLMRPADVKSIDINELFNASCIDREMKYLEAYVHGNDNEIRKKMSKILKVKGYKTVLSYNPVTDHFQWKFYKETEKQRPKTSCVIVKDISGGEVNGINSRTKSDNTAIHRKLVSFSEDKDTESDLILPERILSLGFRDPNRERVGKPRPVTPMKKKPIENEDKGKETIISSEEINPHTTEDKVKTVTTEEKLPISLDSESKPTPPEHWDTSKYEDRCYPAFHICKTLPKKRPLTVCFSLPENEKYSHAEVKQMLVEAFNCDIVQLQFDPLSVRAGDPVVRNRWLVDVSSRAEVDNMVRSGFKLDDVQIVIKTFDEIAFREHSTYVYREKIRQQNMNVNLTMKKTKSAPARAKFSKS